MLNRIIAGDVPTDIVPILTASRGIALVKDEKMNLRPICIGSVILRFVAGLALRLSRREVDDFFLHNAKAKQFGVGVPSGCNLQALAVEEHLLDAVATQPARVEFIEHREEVDRREVHLQ